MKFQKLDIPSQVTDVIKTIERTKFRCYIVGACVYELLLGNNPMDYDIITNADFSDLLYIFRDMRIVSQNEDKSTIMVHTQGMVIQISTYSKGIENGKAIYTDNYLYELASRDFTVNAIAYHPRKGYKDPFDGLTCIKNGEVTLKAIGEYPVRMWEDDDLEESELTLKLEPVSCFVRDPLNIIEAMIHVGNGQFIDSVTAEAMSKKAELLEKSDKRELFKALTKLILTRNIANVILKFKDIFSHIIPQLLPCCEYRRNYNFGYSLIEHIARSVEFSPPNPSMRYAMLFHNIGLPETLSLASGGEERYYGHAEYGRICARRFLKKYGADKKMCDEVDFLIEFHDVEIDDDTKTIKRLLSRFSPDEVRQLIKLRTADDMAKSTTHEGRIAQLRRSLVTLDSVLASGEAYMISQLALSENDLLRRNIVTTRNGAKKLIEQLYELILEQPKLNSAPLLLDYIRKNLNRK